MTQVEIADELEISQPRVSQHLAIARRRYPALAATVIDRRTRRNSLADLLLIA